MKPKPLIENTVLDNEFEAVCATEQTGLIPFAPEDEYELESYNEIIGFSPEYGV